MKISNLKLGFLWLVGSSLLVKLLGIFRESLIAYHFGSSQTFSSFNTLRSGVEFLMAFVVSTQIVEGMLVPMYSSEFRMNENVSFRILLINSKKIGLILFVVVFTLLMLIAYYKGFDILNSFLISFSLSTLLSLYSMNIIYFAIQKIMGKFKIYSLQILLNSILAFTILYFTIPTLSIHAIPVSIICSLLVSNYLLIKRVNFAIQPDNEITDVNYNNLNWYSFFALNHWAYIGFMGKVLIGLENSNNINYYHYSFTILYAYMAIVISNLSTVVVYKSSTSKLFNSLKLTMIGTFMSATSMYILFYIFGVQLIEILFKRGNFNQQDVINTSLFLRKFIFPFSIFAVTQLLLQPLLNKDDKVVKNILKTISIILLISTFLCFSYSLTTKNFVVGLSLFLNAPPVIILFYLIKCTFPKIWGLTT